MIYLNTGEPVKILKVTKRGYWDRKGKREVYHPALLQVRILEGEDKGCNDSAWQSDLRADEGVSEIERAVEAVK